MPVIYQVLDVSPYCINANSWLYALGVRLDLRGTRGIRPGIMRSVILMLANASPHDG